MTLKKLFVVVAGIAFGAAVGLVAATGAWDWWEERPKPKDTTSVTAQYEVPLTDTLDDGSPITLDDGSPLIQFRYRLTNNTDRDITISESDSTLYIQRDDGALIDLGRVKDQASFVEIPAGETVLYFVSPLISYKAREGCAVEIVADPNTEQLREFVEKCYDQINGFVILSYYAGDDWRIDLPFKP